MLQLEDLISTLLLLFVLGLVLHLLGVVAHSNKFGDISRAISWAEGFSDAIPCGVNSPCELGLKCINGFCAKTERLRVYEKDADNEAESSGPYGSGP
jgi:hypothetical protein